jgi:hypothetical protein
MSRQPVTCGNCLHYSVVLPAEPFEMRACVLTLALAKLRWNEKAVLECYGVLFMLIHSVKMVMKG